MNDRLNKRRIIYGTLRAIYSMPHIKLNAPGVLLRPCTGTGGFVLIPFGFFAVKGILQVGR